jgi:hypothetical protein
VSELLGHLCIKVVLDQQLGQLLEQAALANQFFRSLVVSKQVTE